MADEAPQLSARGHVPEQCRLIMTARQHICAIGGKGAARHQIGMPQLDHQLGQVGTRDSRVINWTEALAG